MLGLSPLRGVTAVKFRDYAFGCVGFIPGTVAYVFIGTTASNLLGDDDDTEGGDGGGDSTVQLIVIIVGAIATVIAVVLISIYSKRALNKVLEEENREEDGQDANAMTDEFDREAQSGTRPTAVEHAVRMPRANAM